MCNGGKHINCNAWMFMYLYDVYVCLCLCERERNCFINANKMCQICHFQLDAKYLSFLTHAYISLPAYSMTFQQKKSRYNFDNSRRCDFVLEWFQCNKEEIESLYGKTDFGWFLRNIVVYRHRIGFIQIFYFFFLSYLLLKTNHNKISFSFLFLLFISTPSPIVSNCLFNFGRLVSFKWGKRSHRIRFESLKRLMSLRALHFQLPTQYFWYSFSSITKGFHKNIYSNNGTLIKQKRKKKKNAFDSKSMCHYTLKYFFFLVMTHIHTNLMIKKKWNAYKAVKCTSLLIPHLAPESTAVHRVKINFPLAPLR